MEFPANILFEILEAQKKTNDLLEKLIGVTAATAICDPSGVDSFTQQNAAVFAKKVFDKKYERMDPDFWD